jgi:hypothetical protein
MSGYEKTVGTFTEYVQKLYEMKERYAEKLVRVIR